MQMNQMRQAGAYSRQKRQHRLWKRVVAGLACMVVFCTTYMLILPALTLEQTAYCGIEEHQHDTSCYDQKLVCGLETGDSHTHTDACYQTKERYVCGLEEGEENHTHSAECTQTQKVLTCRKAEQEAHSHTGACYEKTLICGKEAHEHSHACFSDAAADVETQAAWEQSVADISLTGIWADDVVAIAKSQLGYTESKRNYTVTEGGKIKGYTRYGEWYGDPYGDWCALFVSFCLHYAGLEGYPLEESCSTWAETLRESGLFAAQESADPDSGDLIFWDADNDGSADRVGIVAEVSAAEGETTITTIEGDSNDRVQYVYGSSEDAAILGYGVLPRTAEEEEQRSVAAVNTAALSAAPDYIGAINRANAWQIVAQQYSGNANSNKAGYDTDGDGVKDVLLQKNVVPTEKENEFLVYLSVTKQMTWDALLAQSQLGLTTQGKWTDRDVGQLVTVSDIGGNKSNILQPGMGQRNYQATIHLTRGGTTVHTFTGWYNGTTPNASNCTGYIILNGLSGKAIIASAKVNLHQDGSGTGGTLEYTIDLDAMAKNEIYYALDEIELNSVTDVLGDGIIYSGLVRCDGSVSETDGTLTWNITENPNVEGVNYTNPTTGYMENVAQLVYRVKLDVTQNEFHSCADNMDSTTTEPESYAVNQSATLRYQMGDRSDTQNFPVPYVRGLLYNITFDKKSETGKSLAGAVFALYESDGTTPVKRPDGADYTITTAAGQTSRFTNLPTGTYVLKEISPPQHYSAGEASVWTVDLCYTTNSGDLSQDTAQRTNFRYTGQDTDGQWVIRNTRNEYTYQLQVVKTDNTGKKFLQNGSFTVTNPSGGDPLSGITDENGSITFDADFCPNIEYVLSETAAPDGYQSLPADIRFKVIDDVETDTQTVELVNEAELNGLVSLNLSDSEEDGRPVLEIHVINQTGYALPETGGVGTTPFTLCGLGLMAGALVYRYFMRWKRERRFG